ncbi:armadillo-type protein [Auriculariales sp. MPI-PUGE-AT-0066]|nr:armadillo-type protein [Auriculariales sp. MPI-PUGE-AT-0066]
MVNTRVSATTSTITNDKKRLHFNEKLVGKGLTTDALLKRLKTLHTELARFDQEEVDVKSLSSIRKELISSSLVLHRDKGVKAYAACCLADILGLYAPDAPYTQEELKDIFQFFFTQLAKGLVRNDAYYEQYFYLLDSLAKCKSVVLVCDLPNADELLVQVFDDFFTIVKQNVVKNIEMAMSDILCALIDECQSIPTDVLDTVMAQFTEKNAGMEQAGYRLALEVCTSRADRLQRYVCQYFTDIIIQTSSEEELDDLRKAHDLIRQLNRAAPGLLINVVPQLEEQLRVDTLTLRIMATQTLGGMFGDKNGASLAQRHTSTWSAWTNRRNDKAHTVRIALLELVPDVLMAQPELRRDLAETLDLKLEDPDDRVRVAVCKAYAKLDYESLLHTVEVGHLHRLAERVKDKKPNVRTEALATLGKLYKVAFSEIEKNSNAALQHFAWIPERLLEAMRLSADVKQDVETAMAEIILPLPPKGEDEVAWTERLLLVMHCFENEESVGLLLSLAGLKQPRPSPTPFVRFMDYSKAYNGGTINEDEQQVKRNLALCVQKLAAMYFSDRARATEDLNKFGKAENENYMYQVARRIVDPSVDLKTLAKSLAEFSRRIEQSLGPETVETLLRLARTAALWVVNGSSVPTLLSKFKVHVKVSKNAPRMSMSDATALDGQKHAKVLFQALCKRCPEALKVHLPEFSVALMDEKNVELAELALQGIAAIAVLDSKLAPKEKLVLDRIIKYATGKNPRHVKFAARILARLPKPDKCEQVLKTMSTKLSNANPETVLAHITAFAQFAKYAPETFEAQSDSIINFVIPNVLMESCPSSSDEMEVDSEDDWAEDSALPELARAKLTALKMCRNRCLAQQGTKTAEDVTGPALKLIFTILEHNGSVQENADDSGKVRTRMRFQAAICLLQLAQVPSYAQQIVKQFTLLALTIQDPCYNVRMGFLQKYTALSMKLETRFYCIPFLTAQDPERETREYARNFVTIQYQRMPPEQRHAKLEMVFVRYLHLLAHHRTSRRASLKPSKICVDMSNSTSTRSAAKKI